MQEATCPICGEGFTAPDKTRGFHSANGRLNQHTRKEHPGVEIPHARPAPSTVTELFTPEPEAPKRGKFFRSWLTGPSRAETSSGEIRPRRPEKERRSVRRQPSKRHPLDEGIGFLWANALAPFAYASGNYPVARVLEAQGPAAGKAFDDLVAGTFLDKLVQPIAAETDKWGAAASIVALPMAVLAYSRSFDPTTGQGNPMAEQALRWVLRPNLQAMAEAVQRMKAQEAEFRVSISSLEEVGLATPGDPDPMGTFIRTIMAPSAPSGDAPPPPPATPEPVPVPDGLIVVP